jgi:hypothetical protein
MGRVVSVGDNAARESFSALLIGETSTGIALLDLDLRDLDGLACLKAAPSSVP